MRCRNSSLMIDNICRLWNGGVRRPQPSRFQRAPLESARRIRNRPHNSGRSFHSRPRRVGSSFDKQTSPSGAALRRPSRQQRHEAALSKRGDDSFEALLKRPLSRLRVKSSRSFSARRFVFNNTSESFSPRYYSTWFFVSLIPSSFCLSVAGFHD